MSTDEIPPALTAEEWAGVRKMGDREKREGVGTMLGGPISFGADVPRAIAVLNAALPDSDPRKITREMVESVREAAEAEMDAADSMHEPPRPIHRHLSRLAAALASYLPPETGMTEDPREPQQYDLAVAARWMELTNEISRLFTEGGYDPKALFTPVATSLTLRATFTGSAGGEAFTQRIPAAELRSADIHALAAQFIAQYRKQWMPPAHDE